MSPKLEKCHFGVSNSCLYSSLIQQEKEPQQKKKQKKNPWVEKKSSLTVDEKGRKTGFKKSYKERKKERNTF